VSVRVGSIDELVQGWPKTPQESAHTVAEKYGLPDEASDSFLVWHERAPWKRTVLWRDEAEHSFPQPHKEVLEKPEYMQRLLFEPPSGDTRDPDAATIS
jgi:hypothetical protein